MKRAPFSGHFVISSERSYHRSRAPRPRRPGSVYHPKGGPRMCLHQLTIPDRSPARPLGFCGRLGALLALALLGATAARADGPALPPAGAQKGNVVALLHSPGRTGQPPEHVQLALRLGALVIAGLATAHLVGV